MNPRTRNIKKQTNPGVSFRLTAADRSFLNDLAVVQLIDTDTASREHYSHLKNGSTRSLDRLEKAGVLKSVIVRGQGYNVRTFQFANREIAHAFGGEMPVTGAKRTDLHELVTSRVYFELGKPADFRLANEFSVSDVAICGDVKPDAMFTEPSGEVVFVEADSGQYSKGQIRHKQNAWGDVKQVWGQPKGHSFARVPVLSNVTVLGV